MKKSICICGGCGNEHEIDNQFSTALEAAQAYGYEEVVDLEPHGSVDLIEVSELEEKQALEWLRERTEVTEVEGGFIVKKF